MNPNWLMVLHSIGLTNLSDEQVKRYSDHYVAGLTSEVLVTPLHIELFDRVFAFILLVLFLPILALLVIAIATTSRGPILYVRKTIGVDGKEFGRYAFRTMLYESPNQAKAVWAAKNDVRITGVGRFIRKLHLGGLPQLFNVLRGEMSFIGPRPEHPSYYEEKCSKFADLEKLKKVKPGIFGLWRRANQVDFSGSQKEIHSEIEYTKKRSIQRDFQLLFRSLFEMYRR